MRKHVMVAFDLMVCVAIAGGAEKLDRGLVALQREDGSIFLSWRLLKDDPADIAFKVARVDGEGAGAPRVFLTDEEYRPTCFVDAKPTGKPCTYAIYVCTGQQCSIKPDAVVRVDAVKLPPSRIFAFLSAGTMIFKRSGWATWMATARWST